CGLDKAVQSTSESGLDFTDKLNPDSLVTLHGFVEPALANAPIGEHYQFLREGYFCTDLDSKPGAPVFNRTVGLKDSYKG
ncbi:MAG TPA: hypothetical protein PLR57_05995, partial [Clostridia bacterium]|nr:hypothetical protein [Clostridia bacterium]